MPNYRIHSLELGPMANLVYLLEDTATGECAVVDPAWDVPAILQYAEQNGLSVRHILLTHSHHDHINGVEGVLARHDVPVHLLKAEKQFWQADFQALQTHHGGDVIRLGNSEIQCLHTPGHTPGSACYRIEDELLTGDTLFVFGCGRCDLKGGDPEVMFQTLQSMKQRIEADVKIRPGHHYSECAHSTFGDELNGNPFLHFEQPEEFLRYRMDVHDRVRNEPYSAVRKEDLRVADLLT